MTDPGLLALVSAWMAGCFLGAIFYGGLWWTVRRGVTSARPALWFFTQSVNAGRSHSQRILFCFRRTMAARAALSYRICDGARRGHVDDAHLARGDRRPCILAPIRWSSGSTDSSNSMPPSCSPGGLCFCWPQVPGSSRAGSQWVWKCSHWQNLLEIVVGGIEKQIEDVGLQNPAKYIGFLGTLFLFVAMASICTIIPGYSPPTGSLSTTTALALCVFVAVPFFGIEDQGLADI